MFVGDMVEEGIGAEPENGGVSLREVVRYEVKVEFIYHRNCGRETF